MVADASHPTPDDRARAYRSRMTNETSPSVIVDCETAEVLAANAGGLRALGLTAANRLPVPLDSAMPAIATLRDLTTRGLTGTAHKPLMFWKNGRATSWPCSISTADETSPSHVVIIFRNDADGADNKATSIKPANAAPVAVDASAANIDATQRMVRDDHDTLKEIARRIREGQRITSAPSDATTAKIEDISRDVAILIASTSPEPSPPMAVPSPGDAAMPPPAWQDRPAAPAVPLAPPPGSFANTLPPSEIAKLAHELKTPLTAIAAAAEIMRDERLGAMGNDKYLGYAADIHASATHALSVIGDMLAAGASEPNRNGSTTAFDLTELAAGAVSSLQPLAAQRSLALTLEAEADLTPIRANPTAVRQILLNLLTNALKFTPPGGDVRVVTGYLDDGAVYMVVRDTGDGMNEATLAQSFDDQTGPMSLRPGGGRGIGLKMVRRLAAENGAEFEIDSAPGKGTVVLLAFAKDLAGSRT